MILGAFGRGSDTPGPAAPGIWLLDPASGHIRLLDGSHYWANDPNMAGGGFAWTVAAGDTTNEVYRLDLATGKTVEWYKTAANIGALAATRDGELLVAYGDDSRLALLDRSHRLTLLDVPADFGDAMASTLTVAQPGVWIADSSGLDLYMKGVGIHVMVRNSLSPDSPELLAAGDCR